MMRRSDPELSSELRAELERSRRAGHDYDVLGKLPQLRAALKASETHADPPSGESGSASNASPLTQTHMAFSAWKVLLLAAIVGAGAWRMQRGQTESTRAAVVDRPSESVVETQPPAEPASPIVSEAASVAAEKQADSIGKTEAQSDPPRSVRSSRREIAQLVRIRQLLERNPGAAYRLARQSEREFPDGVLSEERRALLVIALANRGAKEEAAREAQAFFARYPQSPMRERVEAALRR